MTAYTNEFKIGDLSFVHWLMDIYGFASDLPLLQTNMTMNGLAHILFRMCAKFICRIIWEVLSQRTFITLMDTAKWFLMGQQCVKTSVALKSRHPGCYSTLVSTFLFWIHPAPFSPITPKSAKPSSASDTGYTPAPGCECSRAPPTLSRQGISWHVSYKEGPASLWSYYTSSLSHLTMCNMSATLPSFQLLSSFFDRTQVRLVCFYLS